VFQDALPDALSGGDSILIGAVNRAQLLAETDRLSPDAIAAGVRDRGREAKAFASTAEIVDHLSAKANPGDVVLIMSNGGFDGLTYKLLDALKSIGARK
jgi:UDP-N-acetylmuramate: L-alanyl-gamma-D-glutamyl-meso-diaminopimelate ligase